MAKISVIIPTYNRKQLLGITLDNILRQTLPASEIIVVDNQSTDGTVEFLKQKYAQKITVLANPAKGPGAARNLGLKVATGDFIKFFDSDDLMTSNTLEVQYARLSQSERGFIYGPYIYASVGNDGQWKGKDNIVLNYHPFSNRHPLWYYMITEGLFITIPGMLFRRELVDEVGPWREDVTASEDWDYLFRLALIEPHPLHTNECAFLYRIHGGQTTEQNFSDYQRDEDKVKVLTHLYQSFIDKDERFSWLQKKVFLNKLYQTYRVSALQSRLHTSLQQYDSTLQRLLWGGLRVRLKAGRMKTGTNWQPSYGPYKSEEMVDKYIAMIGS
jgi:glycosyltransferase involved in cell wall biosynthesis